MAVATAVTTFYEVSSVMEGASPAAMATACGVCGVAIICHGSGFDCGCHNEMTAAQGAEAKEVNYMTIAVSALLSRVGGFSGNATRVPTW